MVCRFLLKDTSNLDKGPVLPLVFIWRDSPIREEITGEHWLSASLTIDLNKTAVAHLLWTLALLSSALQGGVVGLCE